MSGTSEMIAQSINRIFAERVDRQLLAETEHGQWPGELWELIEASGFCQVLATELDDGETPWQTAYPALHAIGFHRLPLPLAETIVGNALLRRVGLAQPTGALTLIQQDGGLELRIEGEHLIVDGAVASVPWARHAVGIVIAGSTAGRPILGRVQVAAPGVGLVHEKNIADEPRDVVRFDHARCSHFGSAENLPQAPVRLMGALARAAQMVGAGQSVLQQSIDYANERVQFGRPIGKYQAVQQMLAVLAGEVACAQTATLAACRSPTVAPCEFDVSVAKIRAGQMAGVAAGIAHEVHGAFGFTYEHTLHFATRRLWCWRAEHGSESFWAARLGRQAIGRGGDACWDTLTTRQSPSR